MIWCLFFYLSIYLSIYLFIYISISNYTGCELTCDEGFVLDFDNCMCNLTDSCLAFTPCENGNCILNSPDNYTCNCTGTGFMGTNCSGKYMCVLYISTVLYMYMCVLCMMYISTVHVHVHVCTVYDVY